MIQMTTKVYNISVAVCPVIPPKGRESKSKAFGVGMNTYQLSSITKHLPSICLQP